MAYVRTVDTHCLTAGKRQEMPLGIGEQHLTMEQAESDARERNRRAEDAGYVVRYEAVDD